MIDQLKVVASDIIIGIGRLQPEGVNFRKLLEISTSDKSHFFSSIPSLLHVPFHGGFYFNLSHCAISIVCSVYSDSSDL